MMLSYLRNSLSSVLGFSLAGKAAPAPASFHLLVDNKESPESMNLEEVFDLLGGMGIHDNDPEWKKAIDGQGIWRFGHQYRFMRV
ncbi:hypothetical protein ACYPKM_04100 [Pseudomonas aeruginosa]